MHYFKLFFSLVIFISALYLSVTTVHAVSPSVMISQVQTGGAGTGTAGQEFVEIYNNSAADVEITNWCVSYTSSSGVSHSTIACFNSPNTATKLWIKAKSYILFTSSDYRVATGIAGDAPFSYLGGIAATGGMIRIYDTIKNEIDKVAWGTVSGQVTNGAPAGGMALQRVSVGGVMQDTDSTQDFIASTPLVHIGGLYETVTDLCPNINDAQPVVPDGLIVDVLGNCIVPPPVDVCPNISELQLMIPVGYLADENGSCQPDSCMNIDGLQISLPDYYDSDNGGNCIPHDECDNLEGAQFIIPEGMIRKNVNDCGEYIAPLELTEILPNVSGSDTGKEYIEIYNPTGSSVDLDSYVVKTGVNLDKSYNFPQGSVINAYEYRIFRDGDMKFTLGNTTGRVALVANDGIVLGDTGIYSSPKDDEAWAFINGVWQFTNTATPAGENTYLQQDDVSGDSEITATVADCAPGKYRNPLTNRCRNIESDASVLASCDSDQYRNPETGRCRKIATTSTLAACKDGQYRSEETNRCRNITTASSELAPCKEGQERNPDTNRCRNATSKTVPAAAYAVEPVNDGVKAFIGWWALGGVLVLAIGYAAWEWRAEVAGFTRRVFSLRRRK